MVSQSAYELAVSIEGISAASHLDGYDAALAADGDIDTLWHSEANSSSRRGYPHDLTIDLGSPRRLDGLLYVPRQDNTHGLVKDFEVWTSDGKTWGEPLAKGIWNSRPTFRFVRLPVRTARFVRFRGLSEVNLTII
jgi:F5/8 type C domain